jgi:glucose/mannose transport system permease protein
MSQAINFSSLEQKSKIKNIIMRWSLYFFLILFALYYLAPLYVMIITSLKSMAEIRQGNLLSLPKEILFDAWKVAWGGREYDAGDVYLRPYFWNSTKMVVPAVLVSTFLGAMNGYVLTKWRFKYDNLFFFDAINW